ncbi:MAG: 2-succinyl-6-hydroxy-2,4-cyclohexadiene-1-carboxylate synthase [FCB group bacterium]|nr:2-succinyl-6-hydroxy-2,4-cyclohexadiene-1-carboxylate synthase [FCB group bacterium]
MIINTSRFRFNACIFNSQQKSEIPVLLLHGFTGSMFVWDEIIPDIPNPVITMDMPGHGLTTPVVPDAAMCFTDVVDTLADFIRGLPCNQVHLCGYSMGGRLALALAMEHPQNIASLILESASPGLKALSERDKRKNRDAELAELITRDFPAFLTIWQSLPMFSNQRDRNVSEWEKVKKIRENCFPPGLAWSLKTCGTGAQPSYWDKLSGLDIPVLLITGEEDQKFTAIAEEMKGLIPDGEHKSIRRSGHTTHLDQKKLFIEVTNEFLKIDRF